MLSEYKTSEVAKITGIHPNTVRLYEEWGLIPKPERRKNGYRVFNGFHIEQIRLIRHVLKVEILQSGIRKTAFEIIKLSAEGSFKEARRLAESYLALIRSEQKKAEEAVGIVGRLLAEGTPGDSGPYLTRKQTAEYLQITSDALRNWELNGLLKVKRKENGYRVYGGEDITRLKIIRALRTAGYSLSSILRLLNGLERDPKADVKEIIDAPDETDIIVSACDKLLTSLNSAETVAEGIFAMLDSLEKIISDSEI